MTFKHGNKDSVTLKAFEKIAYDKGLIKVEAKLDMAPDYSISNNLMENILKLCAGLREAGQEKYANELEYRFMSYKKASKSIVEEAHPEGSHKLEGVQGDALIEDILDQQLKMIDVANKKPTGKLAAKNMLSAVKMALAQSSDTIQHNLQVLVDNISNIVDIYEKQGVLNRPLGDGGGKQLLSFVKSLNKDISKVQAFRVKSDLERLEAQFSPSLIRKLTPNLLGGLDDAAWHSMAPRFAEAKKAINNIIEAVPTVKSTAVPTETKPTVDPAIAKFNEEIKNSLGVLNIWAGVVESDPENKENDKQSALKWINDKKNAILKLKTAFNGIEPSFQVEAAGRFSANLAKIKSDFESFRKEWIG